MNRLPVNNMKGASKTGFSNEPYPKSKAEAEKLLEKLKQFQRNCHKNKRCADCGEIGPTYVCMNFGIFICTTCSGLHRELSHRVKSVSLTEWKSDEVDFILERGNAAAEIYLKQCDFSKDNPPSRSADIDKLRTWIRQKYIDLKWYGGGDSKKNKKSSLTTSGKSQDPVSVQRESHLKKKSLDDNQATLVETAKERNKKNSQQINSVTDLLDFDSTSQIPVTSTAKELKLNKKDTLNLEEESLVFSSSFDNRAPQQSICPKNILSDKMSVNPTPIQYFTSENKSDTEKYESVNKNIDIFETSNSLLPNTNNYENSVKTSKVPKETYERQKQSDLLFPSDIMNNVTAKYAELPNIIPDAKLDFLSIKHSSIDLQSNSTMKSNNTQNVSCDLTLLNPNKNLLPQTSSNRELEILSFFEPTSKQSTLNINSDYFVKATFDCKDPLDKSTSNNLLQEMMSSQTNCTKNTQLDKVQNFDQIRSIKMSNSVNEKLKDNSSGDSFETKNQDATWADFGTLPNFVTATEIPKQVFIQHQNSTEY